MPSASAPCNASSLFCIRSPSLAASRSLSDAGTFPCSHILSHTLPPCSFTHAHMLPLIYSLFHAHKPIFPPSCFQSLSLSLPFLYWVAWEGLFNISPKFCPQPLHVLVMLLCFAKKMPPDKLCLSNPPRSSLCLQPGWLQRGCLGQKPPH